LSTKKEEKDIIKFLEYSVGKSGFSLESKVASTLSKTFHVSREVSYFDKDEKKGRRVDLIVRKQFPPESSFDKNKISHVGQVNFIIECKNIPGNIWIFSEEKEEERVTIPEWVSLTDSLGKEDPVRKTIPIWPIKNIPYVAGYDEFVFDKEKSNRSKKESNNLFSAIYSVTKAAAFEKTSIKESLDLTQYFDLKQKFIIHFMFIQPLILFSGKIFVTTYDGDTPTFRQVDWVQMKKDYVSKEYKEKRGEIHIVNVDKLDEYMELAMEHFSIGSQKIIQTQEKFRTAKNSLKHV